MFTFLRAFSDIPGVECRKKFQVYRTYIFFVKYSENNRIYPGGSMGKEVCRIICYSFYIRKFSHNGGRRDLSFT